MYENHVVISVGVTECSKRCALLNSFTKKANYLIDVLHDTPVKNYSCFMSWYTFNDNKVGESCTKAVDRVFTKIKRLTSIPFKKYNGFSLSHSYQFSKS